MRRNSVWHDGRVNTIPHVPGAGRQEFTDGILLHILREAKSSDLEALVKADIQVGAEDDGDPSIADWSDDHLAQHREKIFRFITDGNKGAWVYEDPRTGDVAGMILCRFRDRRNESVEEFSEGTVFCQLDEHLFPADGRFCEVFQLWVDPVRRREGIGTALKQHLEKEARRRGIKMIYTHTREKNLHVIGFNQKLGYNEVRRGPIWDDVVRVSLIKRLDKQRDN